MKILLTGGSGILGTEMQKVASQFGIQFKVPTEIEMDICDEDKIEEWFSWESIRRGGFAGIIHCAAYTNVPNAEKNQKLAVETNVIGTRNMCELAYQYGIHFTYISTDYVYDGEEKPGGHKETDLTRPVNFYATTKLLGEAFVPENGLTIRTSFKPNASWPYPKAFDDLYTSADYVDIIVPKILDLVVNFETGVYNIGTERKSVYDLARRRNTKVNPMSRKEIKGVNLPSDISMNTDKYNEFYQREYGCDAPDCCPDRGGKHVRKR